MSNHFVDINNKVKKELHSDSVVRILDVSTLCRRYNQQWRIRTLGTAHPSTGCACFFGVK